SVSPDTPVRSVAEKMLDGEVHRILVLDAEQSVLGVISAIDFVRLFAES
ncbi:MAG: CBS domain-containing protein, partial [Planctomycetaceae bacterium]|nr:CBS domain-containing protein [Planctomycetaceae bacterium]